MASYFSLCWFTNYAKTILISISMFCKNIMHKINPFKSVRWRGGHSLEIYELKKFKNEVACKKLSRAMFTNCTVVILNHCCTVYSTVYCTVYCTTMIKNYNRAVCKHCTGQFFTGYLIFKFF